MTRKLPRPVVAATVLLLTAASSAHAGFLTLDSNPASPAVTTTISSQNDFKSDLAGLGVTDYTFGASLALDSAASVTYYYYGKEAGYTNVFNAGWLLQPTGPSQYENYFGAPITIGTVQTGPGLLDFRFCAFSPAPQGCVTNAQNDGLGLGSWQSIGLSVVDSNTAWLFWDDSGAGPDDNHDDMLIKAVVASSVPEPGTLTLFGVSLLGLWFGARRRRA